MRPKHFILLILTTALLLGIQARLSAAEAKTRMSSSFLARGEAVILEVAVTGAKPTRFPEIPPIKGVDVRRIGSGPRTQLLPGRRLEYVFEYQVSSYQVGAHIIPEVSVQTNTATLQCPPLHFSVFHPDELEWSQATAGNTTFRYASAFKILDPKPYEGEQVPVEIKLYIPKDLFVIDWGIPDFERDGLTAWRFQPSALPPGQINLLGTAMTSIAYPSVLAPTRQGDVSIGPATIRLINTQVVMDGILKRVHVETSVKVPAAKLSSQSLPPDAPAGFSNAIGQFTLQVTTPQTNVQEGDPIPVEIVITGNGNLDSLNPPEPTNAAGWKLYDATRENRNNDRTSSSGTTVFRQFLRPLELKGEIPSYQFSYFDPTRESYQSITSDPIPLQMTPAPQVNPQIIGPPQAATTPVEELNDILGLIPNAPLLQTTKPSPWGRWIHLTGSIIAALILLKLLWTRCRRRFTRNPEHTARLQAIRTLESSSNSDHEFLMTAGAIIERWLGNPTSDELRDIIAQRDATCFRPDKEHACALQSDRRKHIIRVLKKALHACLIACTLSFAYSPTRSAADSTPNHNPTTINPATTAAESYQAARYEQAIRLWLTAGPYDQLSADTLYHIGNACYRSGAPGHAALYYRRALALDATHHESRQNLRFLERKYGMLTIQRPNYQYHLTKLPLDTWKNITWLGIWICTLSILIFPATRPTARIRILAIIGLITGPIVACTSAIGWRYFPNDAAFAPIQRQAVIVAENVVLHTEASRNSAQVIQAPAGSVCEVLQRTGKWSYVSLASLTRGWIPSDTVEPIIPDGQVAPPKIRKPNSDETNA